MHGELSPLTLSVEESKPLQQAFLGSRVAWSGLHRGGHHGCEGCVFQSLSARLEWALAWPAVALGKLLNTSGPQVSHPQMRVMMITPIWKDYLG